MKNGNWPCRSTPADVVSTKRFTLRGVAASRLRTATKSLCSGPLSPSHLRYRLRVLATPLCGRRAPCSGTHSRCTLKCWIRVYTWAACIVQAHCASAWSPQCEHESGPACPACEGRMRQPAHAPRSLSTLDNAEALGRAALTRRRMRLCACRHARARAALLAREPHQLPFPLAAAERVWRGPALTPNPYPTPCTLAAPAPIGRECGGAGAAGDGVHALRDALQRAPILQVAVHELQARRRAQQLRGLAGAAAQRAHAVAALRARPRLSAGAGTQCARACAAGVLAAWLRECPALLSDACGCMRARQTWQDTSGSLLRNLAERPPAVCACLAVTCGAGTLPARAPGGNRGQPPEQAWLAKGRLWCQCQPVAGRAAHL